MVTVVCTGGEEPPSVPGLLWLDTCQRIVAADSGLIYLRKWKRRANLWVGDGDSLDGVLSDYADSYDESRFLKRDKDDTDTEAGVKAALELGATEIWLLGGGGRRMDHWLANLRLLTSQPAITRWLTAHEEIWSVKAPEVVAVPSGFVSFFPLGSGPWKTLSTGLRWSIDQVDFSRWHSLSNEASKTGASVQIVEGRYLVLLPFVGVTGP